MIFPCKNEEVQNFNFNSIKNKINRLEIRFGSHSRQSLKKRFQGCISEYCPSGLWKTGRDVCNQGENYRQNWHMRTTTCIILNHPNDLSGSSGSRKFTSHHSLILFKCFSVFVRSSKKNPGVSLVKYFRRKSELIMDRLKQSGTDIFFSFSFFPRLWNGRAYVSRGRTSSLLVHLQN